MINDKTDVMHGREFIENLSSLLTISKYIDYGKNNKKVKESKKILKKLIQKMKEENGD